MSIVNRFVQLCFTVLLAFHSLHGQDGAPSAQRFLLLPGPLGVPPLVASYQEPRVGLRKEIGTSKMKVDIGASVDLLEVRPVADSTHRIRVGIDFFTYALSTSSEGLRLQIDAVDGFFGGHIAYIGALDDRSAVLLRLRLLHLSAHFLDGHFSTTTQTWKENRAPIPFTRDFGELLGFYRFSTSALVLQAYSGCSYATLIRPTAIQRFELLAGFELSSVIGTVFGKPFNLYLADHLVLRRIPVAVGTNNLEGGVKFGAWQGTGLKLFLSYYNGLDPFSQYYDVRRRNVGVGFAFDFW
ncbi:MAG: hypothetical protein C4326_14110 [Ignavibacteria bacterium]